VSSGTGLVPSSQTSLLHGSARRSGVALLVHGAPGSRALRAGILRRRPGAAGRRAFHTVLYRGSAGRRAVVRIAGSRLRSRRTARRIALRERSGAGEGQGCCERNGFHRHGRLRLVPPPPTNWSWLHTFPLPRKADAPRTHASVPRPLRETHLADRERCGEHASVGVQVCRRGDITRMRNGANKRRSSAAARTSIGGHGHSIEWLTKLRAAGLAAPGIRYWRHAGEASSRPARFSINH
jgi:hypothetical protein